MNFLLQTLLILVLMCASIQPSDNNTLISTGPDHFKKVAVYYKIFEGNRDTYHYKGKVGDRTHYFILCDENGTFIKSITIKDTCDCQDHETCHRKNHIEYLLKKYANVTPYPYSRDY